MKAVVLDRPGQLFLKETDAPATHTSDEALVRVRRPYSPVAMPSA
jgi:hypothetical protein